MGRAGLASALFFLGLRWANLISIKLHMPTIQKSDIPKFYQKALQVQQSDQKAAFEIYTNILKANPNIAEAYFQIGRIHLARHAYKPALAVLKQAEALKPNEEAIWSEIVNAGIGLSDPVEIQSIRKVLAKTKLPQKIRNDLRKRLSNTKTKTKHTVSAKEKSHTDAAISAMSDGELAEASKICVKGIADFPKNAMFNLILATAQDRLGNSQTAEENFKTAIRKSNEYAEAYAHYGGFLFRAGRYAEAAEPLSTARKLAPKLLPAMLFMAQTLSELNRHEEATTVAKQAIKTEPTDAEAALVLGTVLERQSKHEDALGWFEKAEANNLKTPTLFLHKGLALSELRRFDEAEIALNQALKLDPKFAKAEYRLGSLAQTKGDFAKAEQHVLRAIELSPTNGEYYRSLSKMKNLTLDDPMITQMRETFESEATPNIDKRNIGFALAKVMEDNQNYSNVFTYLKPANDLMVQDHPYDIEERHSFIAEVKTVFADFDLSARMSKGYKDTAPIFVTGMPRSGTTLVEQIIASHSKVKGAGEVGFVSDAAIKHVKKLQGIGKTADAIKPKDLRDLGLEIDTHLSGLHPRAEHITDKSIQTYTMLPMLKAAMPNARFIVVRRDPRDNLFSIYKNRFSEGTHGYAYDLKTLGTYYKLFDELIAYWRDLFPDAFYEIHYEDLIANQEEEARKLIAAAGLEWEDACLEFYKNKRDVKTLSVYQVRQPIYKSSVKAWEHYKEDLKPLFEALK